MTSLELFRLAGNQFSVLPKSLLSIPKLSWTSLANNPLSTENIIQAKLPKIHKDSPEVSIGYTSPLGAGASGKVYKSKYGDKEVAVKIFNGEVSPDGRSEDELSVAVVLDHPGIPKVLALLVDDSQRTVMELVSGTALADRPDFTSVLRCRYPPSTVYPYTFVKNVLLHIAGACLYLHSLGICHGVDAEGCAKICDFGASFFYPRSSGGGFEKMEVQAFGLMVNDLAARIDPAEGDKATKLKTALDNYVKWSHNPNVEARFSFFDTLLHLKSQFRIIDTSS